LTFARIQTVSAEVDLGAAQDYAILALCGGTAVTITGSNFNPGAKVNFGGAAATVGVITKTSIAVTTPVHALGPVDVEVVNPDNHNDVLRGVFTYQ